MDSFRVIRINNLYDIWMRTFYKQAQHRPLIVQKARVKYGFRGIIPQDAWGGITTRRLIYPAHLQNDVIIDIVDLARCSDTDNVKAHLILNRYGKISAVDEEGNLAWVDKNGLCGLPGTGQFSNLEPGGEKVLGRTLEIRK
ncbi:predicted protein [Histoplasma capsulatum G186AR]|uniref:Uncharacterized protein n=1 Tax=Ajellomyces capsulatus (strain G186AR / H82 / ATCC MYA-2454 / RMSCC 2432) TaxID=447093 RepID=C0NFX3_AJECG|nr:uncharacterized protein HCBG_01789 [Histoplasma capsulatum G186AR]EEH10144.1 predicted protein [Histoplasma capsulatum G186AR]